MLTDEKQGEIGEQLFAFSEQSCPDDVVLKYILDAYLAHPRDLAVIKSLVHAFSGIYETSHPQLIDIFSKSDERQQFIDRLLAETNGNPEGVELQYSDSIYALLLRDASNVDMVRYQMFDSTGFMMHVSDRSWESLLREVYNAGFCTRVYGVLDAFSAQPEFFARADHHL